MAIPAANRPNAGARPRRSSLVRSFALARNSRVCTVLKGQRKGPRGLLVGLALQVAEHDRCPVAIGQPGEFLEQLGHVLGRGLRLGRRLVSGAFGKMVRESATTSGFRPDSQAESIGNSIEPARHGLLVANRARPAGQDQERGLKRIIGFVKIAEQRPAQ